jgi:hypothetical protein
MLRSDSTTADEKMTHIKIVTFHLQRSGAMGLHQPVAWQLQTRAAG